MPVTVYADVKVPTEVVEAGLRGKSIRKNLRSQNQGGFGTANVLWNNSLREYEIGFVPLLPGEWAKIEWLFEVTDAGAFGMLMTDPKDARAAVGAGLLQAYSAPMGGNVGSLGGGYGVPVFRMVKLYTGPGTSRGYARRITRPAAGAVLTRGGVPLVVGGAPGNVGLDLTTGALTFVPDATQAIATVSTGASTVLNFASGAGVVAAMAVGERVYLSGLTGTAASLLNGASHAVAAKGATSLTISTVTSGLAASGGAAARYPQAVEVMGWSGAFYVPVQFASDDLDWSLVRAGPADQRLTSGQSILLSEIRE